jgi:CheY-like chemotaxis protein
MTSKTQPTIMVEDLVVRLQPPAAVGLFSIGLINRFKLSTEGFARRMIFGLARAGWIKSSLILLLAGLWGMQLRGASHGSTNVFETAPPAIGSIQWEKIQSVTRERQELYRKRVLVPGAVAEDVPQANNALFAKRSPVTAAPTQTSVTATGMPVKLFLFAIALFLGGVGVRTFFPDVFAGLNRRFNPWALAPATGNGFSEKVRAEEESFARFAAKFQVGPAVSPRADSLAKGDPVKEFYVRAATLLRTQRTLLQDIIRESDRLARQTILKNLHSEMTSLKDGAGFPETLQVWQVASALEGLLKQLTEKTGNVTPSTLRAVTGGLDLLDDLCQLELKSDLLTDRPLKFLVVDDDLISRQAMSLALKKAFGQPDLAVDAETALAQAGQQAYDVIFLDVQLPGMDGFELCTKIREPGLNRATPVVFVTGQSDFDARAKSTLSGGNDLMGKPFLIFEITVKALTLGLQGRLSGRVQKPLPKLDQRGDPADSAVTFEDDTRSIPGFAIATGASRSTIEADEFIAAFLARAATQLPPLRELCQTILQTPDEEARQNLLADGFLKINSLIAKNGFAVMHPAYQMSAALEGLFKKLLENPKNSTTSTLATAAAAVDLLQDLCAPEVKADLAVNPRIKLLVVDDDLVARRAIVGALQTTFKKPESVEDGQAALAAAVEKPFDVIFLDVIMPGMDGFEVCSKIRETASNRATPVVFVTAASDDQTRARMTRTGGNDLMGKPFLTSEITVKAFTFALRRRLDQLKTQPVA